MNKIDLLKQIAVVNPKIKEALNQAIEALDNPLGVLPGDEIEVFDGTWLLVPFTSYDKDLDEPWCIAFSYYKKARIPVVTHNIILRKVDIKKLEQQRLNLIEIISQYQENGNLPHDALETLDGLQNMLDSWADEEAKND